MLDIPENIESVSMTIISFIRIISVLVDNAIEEAVCSEERYYKSHSLKWIHDNILSCVIVQREAIDLQKIYEKNHSSKEGARGYGLFSLKRNHK